MTKCTYFVVILFITSFNTPQFACNANAKTAKEDEKDDEDSSWIDLPKDKAVPRGSYVRIDLRSGKRKIHVKGPDDADSKDTTSITTTKSDDDPNNNKHRLLEVSLNKLGDDPNRDEEKSKRKFKTYEELKKDFEDLRMAVKTDIEIMNGIMETYKELVNGKFLDNEELQEHQLVMLSDLEYLMHQIDNANEFVKIGGLANIVLPSLNSTSSEIRSGTARLLGSAAQSNVAVQIAALEAGAIGTLLRILTLDKTESVRSSALYALSCLVRRFPAAQKKLVDEGGLTVLNNLFNGEISDKLKVQVKVLTFINDLINEKQDAEKTAMIDKKELNDNASLSVIEEAKEKLRQYNSIGLETRLQEQQWCSQLSTLLIEHVTQHLNEILRAIRSSDGKDTDVSVEHDVIEKVMVAMVSSYNLCLSDYEKNIQLRENIRFLYLWYTKLTKAEGDSDDNYFKYVLNIVNDLSWKYKISLHESLKDEL